MSGPLSGIRIVEFAGLGPAPFAAMLLADFGADVIRIERPGAPQLMPQNPDILLRGRPTVELDLKSDVGLRDACRLAAQADALIEGLRPGVMERLGLGPDALLAENPALVYGRMTGWGQHGPLAARAGHDINYIAQTGLLGAMGGDAPEFPLNLLGDFGGGGMYLGFGILAGVMHARATGQGQVVDAAIVDGTAHLGTMIYSMLQSGIWADQRRANILDGAAPFYRVYECVCGGHMAVGAIEPQFWAALVAGLGITPVAGQMERARWPDLSAQLAATFMGKTRDEWTEIFAETDACATPVLSLAEAQADPHMAARGVFGAAGPRPAPVLSATPAEAGEARPKVLGSVDEALALWGAT